MMMLAKVSSCTTSWSTAASTVLLLLFVFSLSPTATLAGGAGGSGAAVPFLRGKSSPTGEKAENNLAAARPLPEGETEDEASLIVQADVDALAGEYEEEQLENPEMGMDMGDEEMDEEEEPEHHDSSPRPRHGGVRGSHEDPQRPCPVERDDDKSVDRSGQNGGKTVTFTFRNHAPGVVNVFWVDFDGQEIPRGNIEPEEEATETSYPGHVFNVRRPEDDLLVMRYQVSRHHEGEEVIVESCLELSGGVWKKPPKQHRQPGAAWNRPEDAGQGLDQSRWAEFEELAREHASPCLGPKSANWSCVRVISPKDVASRNREDYGFHRGENEDGRPVGQQIDTGYVDQQRYIPNVTDYDTGGFLKMKMTRRMRELLYPWYEKRKLDSMHPSEDIPGGYTNNKKVRMDRIVLDNAPQVHVGIQREMQEVLQWWTKTRLRHTATYGVRIYRRGSMLIDHLDRMDTHVASAVIQVAQDVDEGWPLEVIHPHFPGRREVYLQAGEMVLYEGARLIHGRPKRFEGREFANIFSHFAPMDYHVSYRQTNPFWAEKAKNKSPEEVIEL